MESGACLLFFCGSLIEPGDQLYHGELLEWPLQFHGHVTQPGRGPCGHRWHGVGVLLLGLEGFATQDPMVLGQPLQTGVSVGRSGSEGSAASSTSSCWSWATAA